jgi:Family of unknown function (DUF6677)
MANKPNLALGVKIPLAGLLAWIVPGLGHFFVGDRARGWIILITITLTFWGGVAIGGVRTSVDPQRQKLWFMAQVCCGSNTLAAYAWGQSERRGLPEGALATSEWRSSELALVFTGVAGLLNLLAIMDALMRADPASRTAAPRRDPKPSAEAT